MAEPQITEQIVREAPDIEAIKIALLKDAQELSKTPVSLSDYQVAGLSDLQRAAMARGEAGIGAYEPYIQTGTGLLGEAADPTRAAYGAASPYVTGGIQGGQALMQQGAQGLTPEMVQGYMNPFQQAIAAEINRSYDIAANQARAQAAGAGAFGGSRGEIAQQEINRNRASALAQAQAQAFLNAQNQAAAERQRQMTAGQGIGSLGVSGGQTLAQLGLAQGEALSNLGIRQAGLGEAVQGLGQKETMFGFDLGERQRMLDQMTLDAARKSEVEQAYEPYQRLGFLSDIYKGAPSTQMTLTGASVPTASPFQQLVGGLTAIGSTAAAANKAGLFG
jgi:hypothetical protein